MSVERLTKIYYNGYGTGSTRAGATGRVSADSLRQEHWFGRTEAIQTRDSKPRKTPQIPEERGRFPFYKFDTSLVQQIPISNFTQY